MYQIELTGISISSIMDRQANLSEDSGWQSLNVCVNDCNKVLNGYSALLKTYEPKNYSHVATKKQETQSRKQEKNQSM